MNNIFRRFSYFVATQLDAPLALTNTKLPNTLTCGHTFFDTAHSLVFFHRVFHSFHTPRLSKANKKRYRAYTGGHLQSIAESEYAENKENRKIHSEMPVKNGESDGEGDVSGGESEHSNSSQPHDTSDEEEANECDSDDSSELDASEIDRRRAEHIEDLRRNQYVNT